MKEDMEIAAAEREMAAIRRELGDIGLVSHGYVQDRGPGAGGPCYQWTRKVKAKTVSVLPVDQEGQGEDRVGRSLEGAVRGHAHGDSQLEGAQVQACKA